MSNAPVSATVGERKKAEDFANTINELAAPYQVIANAEINPESDEDINEVLERTGIGEIAAKVGVQDERHKDISRVLIVTSNEYLKKYGTAPSPEMLAYMNANVQTMAKVGGLFLSNTGKQGVSLTGEVIQEAVDDFPSTNSGAINAVTAVFSANVIQPLLGIASQLVRMIPSTIRSDKMEVHELLRLVAKNPYDQASEGEIINANYNHGLSNSQRFEALGTGDAVAVTFSKTLPWPLRKERVFLYINNEKYAVDNGSGSFSLIGNGQIDGVTYSISSQTIDYWTDPDASISVTFSSAPATGVQFDLRVDTDTETYPEFVGEVGYGYQKYNLYASEQMIRMRQTIQAILKATNEHGHDLSSQGFRDLVMLVAVDNDRLVLSRYRKLVEHEDIFGALKPDGVPERDHTYKISTKMAKFGASLLDLTDGRTTTQSWLVGRDFLFYLSDALISAGRPGLMTRIGLQPAFVGRMPGGAGVFYDPFMTDPKDAIGVGNSASVGDGTYSDAPIVMAPHTPAMPFHHTTEENLRLRGTVFAAKYIEDTPGAKYKLCKLTIDPTTTEGAIL